MPHPLTYNPTVRTDDHRRFEAAGYWATLGKLFVRGTNPCSSRRGPRMMFATSAFWPVADIVSCTAFHVRFWPLADMRLVALHMSASDPKRTSARSRVSAPLSQEVGITSGSACCPSGRASSDDPSRHRDSARAPSGHASSVAATARPTTLSRPAVAAAGSGRTGAAWAVAEPAARNQACNSDRKYCAQHMCHLFLWLLHRGRSND